LNYTRAPEFRPRQPTGRAWLHQTAFGPRGLTSTDVGGAAYGESMTETDRQILDFESDHPRHTAVKEHRIITELRLSAARYYCRLAAMTRDPEAVRYAPAALGRIHRAMTSSARQMAAR